MVNNFRRNGLDSLLVSAVLLILLTPMFVIVSDKVYVDMIDKIFYVFTNCLFWFMVPIAITQLLYEKYLKEIDGLVILNPQRAFVMVTGVLLVVYYLFFNMMIIYNVRSPGFFVPVLVLFAPVINIAMNRLGVGRDFLIYGFSTVRLDSISDYRRDILKNGTHTIIIKFNNGRRLEIKQNGEVVDKLEQQIVKKLSKSHNSKNDNSKEN